ncbi:MAG: hypothetical protein H0V65_07220 [Chitinophagales bacterium]|nr:hypothetical protein [Chitinophagales bacterium]
MKSLTLFSALMLITIPISLFAQEPDLSAIVDKNSESATKEFVTATFKGFRIINAQTNETAKKHNLHFNIAHRFGDIASTGAGIHSFFGFDAASDIRFSFDYGITDRLQLGVGRSKGIDAYSQLYDGNIKYRLLRQTTDNKMPVSLTLYGVAAITGRGASSDSTSDASFQNASQRMSYVTQAIITRKFSQSISLQLVPSWIHRNFVVFNDENDMVSLGVGARVKVTRRFAIIADYFYNFSNFRMDEVDADGNNIYFDPLGIGVEIETGGHVFTINFTNSTGILENCFLPFTRSNWLDGQFRFGFNIARNFVIGEKSW